MSDHQVNIDRWDDVCRPAFERTRQEFDQVFKRFKDVDDKLESNRKSLDHKIELNHHDTILLREKLNNGVNDKIEHLEKMMGRLYWVVISAAGTMILSAAGFIIIQLVSL